MFGVWDVNIGGATVGMGDDDALPDIFADGVTINPDI